MYIHAGDESEKYFFSKKGDGNERGFGKWKAIGSVKRIICSERMPIVGIRKTLVLSGKKNSADNNWVMHQFCMALAPNPHSNNSKVIIN